MGNVFLAPWGDPIGDYWENEDKQIVSEGTINFLKERGLSPIEPPDEWGSFDIAHVSCRICFNHEKSLIVLFENFKDCSFTGGATIDETYFFSFYDPNCFDDLVKTIFQTVRARS